MIGLGQEDEIEEITLRTEIWWHDAVYHEADHCMKWPHLANVRIFWSWPRSPRVMFSERLVYAYLSHQRFMRESQHNFITVKS